MTRVNAGGCAVAVLGCGMLGRDVLDCLVAAGYDVQSFDLPNWNICSPGELAAVVEDHDVIINCAAYTDVDGAEEAEDTARAVNCDAVGRLGQLAAQAKRYVIHISTDYVFDGAKAEPYVETDPVCPVNVYGQSKADGEAALQASGCRHSIMRVQWSYGTNGTNFIARILELAEQHPELTVVNDQVGSPTWTRDMAAAVGGLLERRAEGLYHYASRGSVSRFDLAAYVVRYAALSCPVRPCSSTEFQTAAQRPLNSVFDCSTFDREIGISRPDWQSSVAKFLEALI